MGKNSTGRRAVSLQDINAEFRGVRSAEDLQSRIDDFTDEDTVIQEGKQEYRFLQD